MERTDNLTVITIVLDLLIAVAAGHGIGCLGLIEYFWFPYVTAQDFSFALLVSYVQAVNTSAFFSLLGQMFLLVSMCINGLRAQKLIIEVGLSSLALGFFYLTHMVFIGEKGALISLLTGIPCVISGTTLHFKIRNEYESEDL